jgi:bifunctional polynucleotide phosphatase/kinase
MVPLSRLEETDRPNLDNTNADADTRGKWIALATKHAVPIRCVLFTAPAAVCEHNDVVRALNREVGTPTTPPFPFQHDL